MSISSTRSLPNDQKCDKLDSFCDQMIKIPEKYCKLYLMTDLVRIISEITDIRPINIVSVGSGDGYHELFLMDAIDLINNEENEDMYRLICVDPNPDSYPRVKGVSYIKPDYDYVSDLIDNEPDVVSNCLLILNWPLYDQNRERNSDGDVIFNPGYDLEAVQLLNPIGLYTFYGPCGSSGSTLYRMFLNSDHRDTTHEEIHDIDYDQTYDEDYLCTARYTLVRGIGTGLTGSTHELVTLVRRDAWINKYGHDRSPPYLERYVHDKNDIGNVCGMPLMTRMLFDSISAIAHDNIKKGKQ